MNKLRLGVIGAGMAFEKLHYPALQELTDKYEVAAICDVDRFKAEKWAQRFGLGQDRVYTDYTKMLERNDIDAFDILVPISKNFEVMERVARAGRPIICEKPLAPDLKQAKAAAELPAKYSIPIMIAENFRYNEEVDMIRDMVRTEKVGKSVYFMWNRGVFFPGDMYKDKFPAREWRQYADFPGGAFMDTGVHDMAFMRHVFGSVKKLQAFGVPQKDEFSPYAVLNLNVEFHSGVTGQYSFYCAGKEMQRPLIGFRIFGTEGMIYLEERDCGTINVAHNTGKSEQIPYRPQRGYYNELLNFYNAAIGTEPIAVTPEMEFGDAKMILAALESIREGTIVEVDQSISYVPGWEAKESREYQTVQ